MLYGSDYETVEIRKILSDEFAYEIKESVRMLLPFIHHHMMLLVI